MNDEDVADWEALGRGDPLGLARLFDRHEARLFRHAARLLTVREDAKDAVAIAFFELWRRRGSVRLVDGSPLPWLINTVSNTSRNLERSARRYRAVLGRVPSTPAAEGVRPADETGVLAALRRLPEKEQSVVVLTIMQGYRESETATALGIPVGTVKSRLSRAKARLRGELEQMGMVP
ncbi:RNA polymerase sigma factor [Microbacterium sp. B2969]|uniref:RNA polymerase sigma factor n=1 Tax=Microbacterium alkaliflavum TaxID=3248839 RepID=A0ABW7Q5H3_9MICO